MHQAWPRHGASGQPHSLPLCRASKTTCRARRAPAPASAPRWLRPMLRLVAARGRASCTSRQVSHARTRRRSAARRPLCFNTHMQPARGWRMLCRLYSMLAHPAPVVWSYRATDRRAWGPMATVPRWLSTATKLRGTAWRPRTMAMAMAHKRLAATKVRGLPACPDYVMLFTPGGGLAPVPRQNNLTRVHARLRCLTDEFCLCRGLRDPAAAAGRIRCPRPAEQAARATAAAATAAAAICGIQFTRWVPHCTSFTCAPYSNPTQHV